MEWTRATSERTDEWWGLDDAGLPLARVTVHDGGAYYTVSLIGPPPPPHSGYVGSQSSVPGPFDTIEEAKAAADLAV